MSANPRLITNCRNTHVMRDQTVSLAELAARQHPRTTACGQKVVGMTGHHVAGDFSVSCKSCRKTRLFATLAHQVRAENNRLEA